MLDGLFTALCFVVKLSSKAYNFVLCCQNIPDCLWVFCHHITLLLCVLLRWSEFAYIWCHIVMRTLWQKCPCLVYTISIDYFLYTPFCTYYFYWHHFCPLSELAYFVCNIAMDSFCFCNHYLEWTTSIFKIIFPYEFRSSNI